MKPVWIGLTFGLIGFVLGGAAGHYAPVPPLPLLPERREPVDMDVQQGVALHEAGHAVVRAYLQGADKVERIELYTKLPPSGTFGATVPRTRAQFSTRDQLMQSVIIRLAGRAADDILGQGADTGADTDLDVATDEMKSMYAVSGMGGSLLTRDPDTLPEHTLWRIETELSLGYQCSAAIIALNRRAVETVADVLLVQTDEEGTLTLDSGEFAALLEANPLHVLGEVQQATMHAACLPHAETLRRAPQMCPHDQLRLPTDSLPLRPR
jgi:hypothetical protein